MDFVRADDTFVVTKLDLLARSVHWRRSGVTLHIVNLGADPSTSTGKLIMNVLDGVAQFVWEITLDR